MLEGLEEFTHFILRQADAVVAYFKAHQTVLGVRHHLAHFHGNAALFAELDGVIGVVDQHLPQAQRIAHQHGRQLRVDLEQQFQVLAGGARCHHRHQGLHHVVETEVDALDFQLARLDFRDVEDIVDDAQQVLAGKADLFQVIALARLQVRFQGEIGHADHAIHRRADFMAHIGQELPLRQARFFGHLLGLVELLGALRHALFQMFIEFAQSALAALVIRDVRQAGHYHAHLAVFIADGLGIYGEPRQAAVGLLYAHQHVAHGDTRRQSDVHGMAALVESGAVFADGLPQAVAGRARRQHALGGGIAFQDMAVAVLHHQAVGDGTKHGRHALARIRQGDRRLAPFRDVGNHRQRAARLAIVRLNTGARQQTPQAGQVLAEEAEVDLVRLAGEAAMAGQAALHQQLAVAVHEVKHGTVQHFLHRVAQHLRHLRVDESGFAIRIRHPDAFGRRLHDQAVAL